MSYDELELDRLGDEKSALFFLISDTDTTYNFLVALAFSQMFNLLCERADNTYGGRLPHHVRVAVLGIALFFTPTPIGGIVFLFFAFLLSPYGLQAAAGSLLWALDGGKSALYRFLAS